MRVALVCPYDLGAPGGVQQVVTELAARLVAEGDEAIVVGVGVGSGAGVVGVGRPVTVRANGSAVPLSLSLGAVTRVRAALAGFDVVHVHEPFVPVVGWAALGAGLPTVATFHAAPARWTASLYRVLAPLGRRALAGAAVSAVSPVAAAALPGSWGPVSIVPNGIDTSWYPPGTESVAGRVAFLGRDDHRKGLDVLLAAWPEVRRARPDATLVVMGAERAEGPPGVVFTGRVGEGAKRLLLAESAVFVAPHLGGESFGIVLVEAMAARCAVVASDLPAFRDVLGGAGTLVPPGDTEALAGAIVALLDDPAEAARRIEAGSRRATTFEWSEVVAGYRRLYARVREEDVRR